MLSDGAALRSVRRPEDAPRQCAALPLTGSGDGLRVVMVTSRATRRWVIPKGWIEPGEAPHRSAAREAFEEAGILGETEPEPIGRFVYNKRKARGVLLLCEVLVFRLRVESVLPDWPERRERDRLLVPPEVAAAMVAEPELAALLRGIRR
ncbi:NUDIX hydrolase [Falsiroseomonas selenitidurans]|uniref:NUDIX hydrolase n=1 Tax=Falsiroseomonas selenitidurans TaxID=2716335 RepID=A0ABX1E0F2_9PROT|nr:NUDIX hydrolase [Falsiroseomonas selenitidurans]NKC30631.1 NUDIX hydrolase [Falsiroseomonas selenitidurans]